MEQDLDIQYCSLLPELYDEEIEETVRELIKSVEEASMPKQSEKKTPNEKPKGWLRRNSDIISLSMSAIMLAIAVVGLSFAAAEAWFAIPFKIDNLTKTVGELRDDVNKYLKGENSLQVRVAKLEEFKVAFDKPEYTNVASIYESVEEILERLNDATREREALNGRIVNVSTQLRGEINTAVAELSGEINTVEAKLRGEMKTMDINLRNEIKALSAKVEKLDLENKLSLSATKFEAKQKGLANFKNGLWSITDYGEQKLAKIKLHKIVQSMVVVTSASPPSLDEDAFLDNLMQMTIHDRVNFENRAAKVNLSVEQLIGTMLAYAHSLVNKNGTDSK
ncbi:MAG: hypothetical protein ACE5JB_15620 [bacterium]